MMDYVIGFGIGVVTVVMVYEVCASIAHARELAAARRDRARRRREMGEGKA